MRRLLRRAFNGATATSALMWAATCVLWVRSYRSTDRVGSETAETGFALRSRRGWLEVMRPPGRGPQDRQARELAARIRNQDMWWEPIRRQLADETIYYMMPHLRKGTATWDIFSGYSPTTGLSSVGPPLLAALEDPGRTVAAHELLDYLWQGATDETFEAHEHSVTIRYDGLPLTFSDSDARSDLRSAWPEVTWANGQPIVRDFEPPVRADLSARKALIVMWHDRLDVPVLSLGYGWLLVATVALPASVALRGARRWNRRARGRCPACGYDLRATPGKCPECGAVRAAQGDT
jgi:hypothetical protein